jgi:glutaminyl-peptide cyclotransferase
LVDIQEHLKRLGLIHNEHLVAGTVYPYSYQGIDDDHRPFRDRNVSVVHMIPQPFPKVWHTLDDNENALDMQTIQELSLIVKTFVIEYLGL